MKWSMFALAVGLASGGAAPSAHHSIAAVYDSNQPVRIEGVVTELQFINPHPLVTVEVAARAAEDRAAQWRLEMDNRSELASVGFTNETLRPGDRVIVTGSRARNGDQRLYIRRLDRPSDGFWYEQVGGTPKTSLRSR
jgi:hypothetical protein